MWGDGDGDGAGGGGGEIKKKHTLQASHIKNLTRCVYTRVYVFGLLSTQLNGRTLGLKNATLEYLLVDVSSILFQ